MPRRTPKRRTEATPRSRAIERFAELGWTWVELERRGRFGRTHDIWACDFLCVHGNVTILLQVTGGDNHSKRRKKMLAVEELRHWVKSPSRSLLIWSWDERGKAGEKEMRLRQERLTPRDFEAAESQS